MSGATGRIAARFSGRLGEFSLDVSLDLPARGVSVFFGPSGCGKTTLLRCIAGLERLDGRLEVAGAVWQAPGVFVAPHRRPVGFVFQEASLLPHLSVRRNLLFGYSRVRGARPISLDQVVDLLGLEPLLERGAERLSGGERQRVGIGRALLSQPGLLLMDEPLASLDAARKAEVLPYLERLHASLAIPILYVTHDAGEALRLGDRLVRMEAGAVLEVVETPDGEGELLDLDPAGAYRRLKLEGVSDQAARLAAAALAAGLDPWKGPG